MKNFNYHQSTKILFGRGRIRELAEVVLQYGKRVLLVTTPAANPAFSEFTWEAAVPQFAKLAKILNPHVIGYSDHDSARKSPDEIVKFLQAIGLNKKLSDIKMPENEIEVLAKQCMVLPDY